MVENKFNFQFLNQSERKLGVFSSDAPSLPPKEPVQVERPAIVKQAEVIDVLSNNRQIAVCNCSFTVTKYSLISGYVLFVLYLCRALVF